MSDRLQLNQSLNVGDQLVSPDGRAAFILQSDGNFVLYRTDNRQALWSSKTNGRGVVRVTLQTDGNLVLLDRNGAPVWAAGTRIYQPGTALVVQNDGNAVLVNGVFLATGGAWSTESAGYQMKPEGGFLAEIGDALSDAGAWVANAAKAAGKAIGTVATAITSAAGEIGHLLSEIPIIGPGLQGFYDWTYGAPFALADSLLKGERVDRALVDSYKSQLNDLHEMAPYVQTAIAFIPAVGPGMAGAISAGFAIADGKTIDAAMVEAVKGSIPGGALAEMAFDAGAAALQGKPVTDVLLSAVPIPDEAKTAIKAGMNIASDLAAGKPLDEALLAEGYNQLPAEGKLAVDTARKLAKGDIAGAASGVVSAEGKNVAAVFVDQASAMLPDSARQALNTGMAFGHATNLQAITSGTLTSAEFLTKMADNGRAIADSVVVNARSFVPPAAQHAFDIGMGMMGHSISQHEFTTVRNALNDAEKKGFDTAAALQIGRVTTPLSILPSQIAALAAKADAGIAARQAAGISGGLVPIPGNPVPTGVDAALIALVNGKKVIVPAAAGVGRDVYAGGLVPSQATRTLRAQNAAWRGVTLADAFAALYRNLNYVSPDGGAVSSKLGDADLDDYLVSLLLDGKLTISQLVSITKTPQVGYFFGGRMAKLTKADIVARLKGRSAWLRAHADAVMAGEARKLPYGKTRRRMLKQASFAGGLVIATGAGAAYRAVDPPAIVAANGIDKAIAADATPTAPPVANYDAADAGYLLTRGLQGAVGATKAAIIAPVAASPDARSGAADALTAITVTRVAAAEKYKSLWDYVRALFGHPMIDHSAPASVQLAQANKILGIS